jgi:2-keto-4-pentenoate hydratase/2-oxohepta-3-ene-1,7-dioic acid hydratase in catechol pathway
MKLATFTQGGRTRIGVVIGNQIADLAAGAPDLPSEMTALLSLGHAGLAQAQRAAASAPRLALDSVRLEAPVPRPGKYLAVGLNYADHIREIGASAPEFPSCFAKLSTCINGPYDPVHRPRVSATLDYEGELGLVIGRRCRHVRRHQAAEVIAGYVVVNDFTVREWVKKTPQVVIAKSFDTHGPFGPWIATPDEVGDPYDLAVRTWVNGELRQNSNTGLMVFGCYELVEILSSAVTLEPGDVLATGTPHGVGAGFDPARYLVPGDVVKVEIPPIGSLVNTIIDEPETTAVI